MKITNEIKDKILELQELMIKNDVGYVHIGKLKITLEKVYEEKIQN